MNDKRVTVWVQKFADRTNLMLQWIDPDTNKRKSESAGTADEGQAEKKRADREYELNHGIHQERSKMTWERFRELFEDEYLPACRPDTQRNYRAMFDLFERLVHPRAVAKITERTVSAFAAAMRKEPGIKPGTTMQPGTVKVRLQFLHTALQWATDQKILSACPDFPSVKVPKRRPQPIPTESFEKLLDKAPDHQTRTFLLCGWLAGLRLNEALELRSEDSTEWPWVDFARNRIWLPAGFVKAVEDQWVPLDPVLREALLALPQHGDKVFRFVEGRSGKPVGDRAVGNRIAELARAAGVRMTMKELRKGFGCRYAGKVPAQVLQKLMRHANIKTTMDFYANVDAAVEEAVLGPQRNTQRNTTPVQTGNSLEAIDEKPSGNDTSV